MKKEVSVAHLEAAIADDGKYYLNCVLGQVFRLIVGLDGKRYCAFNSTDGPIMYFCETGNKIARLFDKGSKTGDLVMPELREMLPIEVELYEN
jgi:hypothetical protein